MTLYKAKLEKSFYEKFTLKKDLLKQELLRIIEKNPQLILQVYVDKIERIKEGFTKIACEITNKHSQKFPEHFCDSFFSDFKGEKSFIERLQWLKKQHNFDFPEKVLDDYTEQLNKCWQEFSEAYQSLLPSLKKAILKKEDGFKFILNENVRREIPHSLFLATLQLIVSCIDEKLKIEGDKAKDRKYDLSAYKEIVSLYVVNSWDLYLIPLVEEYPAIFVMVKNEWSEKSPMYNDVVENRQKVREQALVNPKNFGILYEDICCLKNNFRTKWLLFGYGDQAAKDFCSLVQKDALEEEKFFIRFCDEIFHFSLYENLPRTLLERLQELQKDECSEFKLLFDKLDEQIQVNTPRAKALKNLWNVFVEKSVELKSALKNAPEGSVAGFDVLLTKEDKNQAIGVLIAQKRIKFPKPIAKMIIKRLIK